MISQTRTINGLPHTWLEAGGGEAVVIVHGIGSHARAFEPQAMALALSKRYRVFVWNLPGYGESGPLSQRDPSAGDYAARLQAFLESSSLSRAHFVGHSLGAIVVCALLRSWSGHASSCTLLQPVRGFGHLDEGGRDDVLKARVEDVRNLGMTEFSRLRGPAVLGHEATTSMAGAHLAIMTEIPEDAYLQAWRMMCGTDLFDLLETLTCPTQVICGGEDKVSTPALCKELAGRLPGAQLETLPRIGHSAAIECPDALTALLAAFIDTHCAEATP